MAFRKSATKTTKTARALFLILKVLIVLNMTKKSRTRLRKDKTEKETSESMMTENMRAERDSKKVLIVLTKPKIPRKGRPMADFFIL